MTTDVTTNNLKINVLDKDSYDGIGTKNTNELYVVKQKSTDTDNSISSRSYADVGRLSVQTSTTEPTSEFTQIWIDPTESVVYISPATTDLDNLTQKGKDNISLNITPDFDASVNLSNAAGTTYELLESGWVTAYAGESSKISIRRNTNLGERLITLITPASTQMTDRIFLAAGTIIYFDLRSGTTEVVFYPYKGLEGE